MTTWGVVLDPSEVATGRTELDLNTGPIRVDQAGIDWGDAAITAYMAEQKWGSTPVDFVVPNRVVTIPLMIGADDSGQSGFDTARVKLHQKLALIQAEGGWLKRESDLKMYADIMTCTPHIPDQWGETGGIEQASLQLECLPDFYGDEITLDAITGTEHISSVLQLSGVPANIDGDYPARCRVKVTSTGATVTVTIATPAVFTAASAHGLSAGDAVVFSTSGALPTGLTAGTIYYVIATGLTATAFEVSATPNGAAVNTSGSQSGVHQYSKDYRSLLWAFRSRHYNAAATAKEFYEAEAMTPLDAAATFSHTGFSGGSTLRHNSLPAGSWCPVLLTDLLSGGALTHQGSYRIVARAYSATATPQLRLVWGIGDVAHPVINDPVKLPGAAGTYMVDLGQVRLDAPPTGTFKWKGIIQALAVGQNDPIEIDCVYVVPLDESAGRCVAVQSPASSLGIVAGPDFPGSGADDAGTGTIAWATPTRLVAEDGSVATASQTGTTTTHYLKSNAHGFAVPAGATISGIKVEIKRSCDFLQKDARIRLVRAGTVEGVGDHADTATSWPNGGSGSLAWKSYGGSADLWGAAWTPADVNSATFGAAVSAVQSLAGFDTCYVDAIRITVYYTTSGGFATTPDAVVYATRQAELRTEGMCRQDATGTLEGMIALVTGDLPRLPPSGLEGRSCELFLKPSRGNMGSDPDGAVADTFSAQVLYRPCYLARP